MLHVERRRGWPDEVPRIADTGWRAFAERAPDDVNRLVTELRRAPWTISAAVATTPTTFLHGDWKMGNLGSHADGRTILIDCAYPGEGPACHELGWYLAINRARLPESKEAAIERFRSSLERHGVSTTDWWERQLDICLLGTLVQFGWEKALGDADELAWWSERARAGARRL
jgi:thiamine kinase-like enzyme